MDGAEAVASRTNRGADQLSHDRAQQAFDFDPLG
jgi:hypothetical protein